MRNHVGEARAWIDQLLPIAESLDPPARAELAWAALATAIEAGADAAALTARDRLAALLDSLDNPHPRALSDLVMLWVANLVGGLRRRRDGWGRRA